MIDLSPVMDRALSSVGKVSGSVTVKSATSRKVRIGSPKTGSSRVKRDSGGRAASSRRVGSSALDLRDCMVEDLGRSMKGEGRRDAVVERCAMQQLGNAQLLER